MSTLRTMLGNVRRRLMLVGRTDDQAAVLRQFHLLRLPKKQPGSILWRGLPLHYADGPSLYYQLADIHVSRVYDFTCETATPRILDVGGNLGVASLHFRRLFPGAEITVFEPDPALVRILRRNLETTGDCLSQVVAAAAWTRLGQLAFAASGDDSGALDPTGDIIVPTVDLASYCERPVDFLKLDVEGAEFELIAHLRATGALSRVRRLNIELHEWGSGTPRFHEVLNHLVADGFNYRVSGANTFGSTPQPAGFTNLAHPANHVTLYAWRKC